MENNEFISSASIDIATLWESIKEELAKDVSTLTFDVWISSLEVIDIKENTLVVATQTRSARDMLIKNYKKQIIGASNRPCGWYPGCLGFAADCITGTVLPWLALLAALRSLPGCCRIAVLCNLSADTGSSVVANGISSGYDVVGWRSQYVCGQISGEYP